MTDELHNINNIHFGLLSGPQILKQSVAEINISRFTSDGHNLNSVYDPRMGPMKPTELCPTCNLITNDCSGHFGHIKLNVSIVHPMFYKHVLRFLQCTCIQCGDLLFTKEHLQLWNLTKYKKEVRFTNILDRIKKENLCTGCHTTQPKISFIPRESTYFMIYTSKTSTERIPLHIETIQRIFNNISNEQVALFGFDPAISHPRDLIITYLPVLPPRSRPFIVTDNKIHDDDLTVSYNEIVKINANLDSNNMTETKKEKLVQSLIFRVKTLFDNSQKRAKHTNSKPMKGIKERLAGKTGLMRMNTMGERLPITGSY